LICAGRQNDLDSAFKHNLSEMFTRMNSLGVGLTESNLREALFWVNKEYDVWFNPVPLHECRVTGREYDFCKCLALISQYKKQGQLTEDNLKRYDSNDDYAKEGRAEGDSRAIPFAVYSREYIEFTLGLKSDDKFSPIPVPIAYRSDIEARFNRVKAVLAKLGVVKARGVVEL